MTMRALSIPSRIGRAAKVTRARPTSISGVQRPHRGFVNTPFPLRHDRFVVTSLAHRQIPNQQQLRMMTTAAKSYPESDPYDSGKLPIGDIHVVHYEQHGNPQGKPVIFVHGGPGAGCYKVVTAFFNPAVYRIILYDQRGAGKSTPVADIRNNTSADLVADIEVIREHLSIPKWHLVFGGSWGSTLALLYAQDHPDKLSSIILRGIFTGRKSELDYMFSPDGAIRTIFPEAFDAWIEYLPEHLRADPVKGYSELLNSTDPKISVPAVTAWNAFEETLMRLEDPLPEDWKMSEEDEARAALQVARIECHYFLNGCFIEEGQILKEENMAKIRHLPAWIIHGRLDMVCPPVTAVELHRKWPGSKLFMIPRAGHLASEPAIKAKLIEACDEVGAMDL